jgi:hypothetical protein
MTLLQFLVVPRNISDDETPIVAVRTLSGKGPVAKTNSKVTWVTRKTPPKKNSVFLIRGALTHGGPNGLVTGTVYDAFNVCEMSQQMSSCYACVINCDYWM